MIYVLENLEKVDVLLKESWLHPDDIHNIVYNEPTRSWMLHTNTNIPFLLKTTHEHYQFAARNNRVPIDELVGDALIQLGALVRDGEVNPKRALDMKMELTVRSELSHLLTTVDIRLGDEDKQYGHL